MILRRFADADGFLWFFNKRRNPPCIARAKPERLFVHNHVYSHIRDDGTRDASLEKDLAQIEGTIAPLLERLVKSARNLTNPNLTSQEHDLWDLFFYIQWKRLPQVYGEIIGDVREPIDMLISQLEDAGRVLTREERAALTDPAWLETIRHNTLVDTVRSHDKEVMDVMRTTSFVLSVIADDSESFVIGSSPIVPHQQDGSRELLMPIAHDVAIGLGGSGRDRVTVRKLTNADTIRRLNTGICDQSNLVAGRSARLLCSLTGVSVDRS